jgi:hypothetical protein
LPEIKGETDILKLRKEETAAGIPAAVFASHRPSLGGVFTDNPG